MYDLIIIGAGPAGLTAGLYAGRYRLKTVILEKMACGGQILLTPSIENFPGFPSGIATEELVGRMKEQVADVGVTIENTEALSIEEDPTHLFRYSVKAKDGDFRAKTLIIASGAQAKRLGVEGEEALIGKGVSYCGTCDGPLFKNKEVVVVGAGDRAIEDALFLTNYAAKVTLVHRRQQLRASQILQEKARNNAKIAFLLDSVVEGIIGEHRVEAVKIKNLASGVSGRIPAQGVFIFVGILPNTAFLKHNLLLDPAGFIVTDSQMLTSKPGIFACGDCRAKSLYQVVNACGEAAVAVYEVNKYLLEQR